MTTLNNKYQLCAKPSDYVRVDEARGEKGVKRQSLHGLDLHEDLRSFQGDPGCFCYVHIGIKLLPACD